MQNCIFEVKSWTDCNKLKLIDDKTESILIKSDRVVLPDSASTSIRVGNSDIPFASHARNLGITISSNTTMGKHICRSSAYAKFRSTSSIRHLLTVSTTKTLLCAFVLSMLGYSNSLLSGLRQHLLDKPLCVEKTSHEIP